jgi:signal transduction histidine kinase
MNEVDDTSKEVRWLKQTYFADTSQQLVLQPGETLLREGSFNDRLYLIIDGVLTGFLEDENAVSFEVFKSTKNMFVGVYSFFSADHRSYLTIVANEKTTVAYIDQHKKKLSEAQFARDFLPVIVHEIYLRQVLAQKLTQQRQEAIQKLYENEKMAMLGQLAAGLAHELNNAVGVLPRNTDWLIQALRDYLKDRKLNALFETSVHEGVSFNTLKLREKRKALEAKFQLPAKLAKQLAKINMNDQEIEKIIKGNQRSLDVLSVIAEAGFALHDMKLAATHSTHVVQSVRELGFKNGGERVETSVLETLNSALALLKTLTQGVEIGFRSTNDAVVLANPGDLVQVWVNLIKNACESLSGVDVINRKIFIEIIEGGPDYLVKISDNGPGIEEILLPRVFEPNLTTKVKGLSFGLGLGLSTVKKIVTGYKGSVEVKSKPGETIFTVQFPKHPTTF